MRDDPYPKNDAVRSIALGIIFSLLTCGIYALYWQYKQMETLNAWLRRNEYSFWLWLLLSIVTCGIFGIYYEYKMASGINEIQHNNDWYVANNLAVICVVLAVFGIGIASLAIQQSEINKFYGERSDY